MLLLINQQLLVILLNSSLLSQLHVLKSRTFVLALHSFLYRSVPQAIDLHLHQLILPRDFLASCLVQPEFIFDENALLVNNVVFFLRLPQLTSQHSHILTTSVASTQSFHAHILVFLFKLPRVEAQLGRLH